MKKSEKRKPSEHQDPAEPRTGKKSKKIEEDETEDMPKNIPFVVRDGIRHLAPYWSIYRTWTKRRWIGRTFENVFSQEFLSTHKHYARVACRMGRFFINGKQMTDPNRVLDHNERILHVGHRHEHQILDVKIEIISETEDFLVVNKPASLPVHSCGQYRAHTVLGLLERENGINGLRVIHRLDRPTSGVLIFAKNYETDLEFKRSLLACDWKKEYLCRVRGEFPEEEVECSQRIGILSPSMGIQCVREDGKDARSKFKRLWTDGKESLVSCKIATGRTHQIRVHLQWLGFPIVSDTVYNSDEWGPEKGKHGNYGKSFEQLREDVQNAHRATSWREDKNPEYDARMEALANTPENNAQITTPFVWAVMLPRRILQWIICGCTYIVGGMRLPGEPL
ncbi:hypothetical protein FO519_007205 [Halicephalobus sp. NKZ332]|nr:hypothetical protein FO519_007205 [Halicephalobus sp. NKZ332]